MEALSDNPLRPADVRPPGAVGECIMFKVILLICAANLSRGECRIDTARSVLYGPDAKNEIVCGLQSQAYLAATEIGRNLKPGEYLKISCRRTTIGAKRVGSLAPGGVPWPMVVASADG